ncbi:MAG: Holliday junction resolvase RuvX [Aureispira sp.]|nr:Holliday junction resolvase RuvX [Aureispira sp.]
MARIMAIDFGTKRTGIATTDSMQLIASPLSVVETPNLLDFFDKYLSTEQVECIVIGQALRKDGTASRVETKILKFIQKFSKKYPNIQIDRQDEGFTSTMAEEVIRQTVKSRKKRREDKGLIDKISATIILQEYMGFL